MMVYVDTDYYNADDADDAYVEYNKIYVYSH